MSSNIRVGAAYRLQYSDPSSSKKFYVELQNGLHSFKIELKLYSNLISNHALDTTADGTPAVIWENAKDPTWYGQVWILQRSSDADWYCLQNLRTGSKLI